MARPWPPLVRAAPASTSLASTAGAGSEEVVARPTRRRFSAQYKLRIVHEAERCAPGELGALLRREGLYASHLTSWRKQRETGALAALAGKKRGPKVDPQADALARLQRENAKLQAKLARADLITLAPAASAGVDAHTCPGGRCQGKKLLVLLNLPILDVPEAK